MKMIHWICMLALLVSVSISCGPKGSSHEMGEKTISTEKLDVVVFGKGLEAKFCPVSGDAIPTGKGYVYILKDGRKIMLCCTACVSTIEANKDKYKEFYY